MIKSRKTSEDIDLMSFAKSEFCCNFLLNEEDSDSIDGDIGLSSYGTLEAG